MKWFLNVYMALSILFSMRLLGETNWYLVSIVFIAVFNAVDASFSMRFNPGLITWNFKYIVNYVKACIIYLSLLFLISVVRMALKSYTYMR